MVAMENGKGGESMSAPYSYNQINNYAYSAKSRSTDVQYSEKDTPLVEFMRSEQSEKQA